MIEVSDTIQSAFKGDAFNGNVTFTIDSTGYDAHNILANSTTITESLSSGENINFNAVEKSCLEITLINITENIKELKGKTLTMKQTVLSTDIPLGVYTIADAVNDGDYLYDITAYDNLYKFEVDVSAWWNEEVEFPITIRDLLISLCTKVGVQYNFPASFTNSTFTVTRNTYIEGALGTEFLGYIQEVCAGFIKPDRTGVMKFVQLLYPTENILYPATTLYPSDTLYPDSGYDAESATASATYTVPLTRDALQLADYEVQQIDSVQVKGTENDVGILVGAGSNPYVIQSNPLLYSFTGSSEDSAVITNILNVLSEIKYVPVSATFKALPYVEVGDLVRFESFEGKEAYAPLLKRSMKGFLLNQDEIDIKGTEQRPATTIYANKLTKVLNQQVHELINTLTELSSVIQRVEIDVDGRITDIRSEIQQTEAELIISFAQTVQQYLVDAGIDEFIENARMSFTFNNEGMTIVKSDAEGTVLAEYRTEITNDGLRVVRNSDDVASLVAEEDSVIANNLTADQYLRVRTNDVSSRFQSFYSSAHGDYEFGVFWEI